MFSRPPHPDVDLLLDLEASLVSSGIDSISFAQVRGQVNRELGLEIPMMFLSEAYTIRDMIESVVESST